MKNSICLIALILVTIVSCKNNDNHHDDMNYDGQQHDSIMNDADQNTMMNNETNGTTMNDKTAMYSCPMHPEVHGKMHDKCSKCGMDLTLTEETKEKK